MGLFDIFKKKSRKQHHNITVQPETYICARCKKEITDEESEWIGNHRFCTKCAAPPKVTSTFKPEQVIVGCFDNVMAIVNGKIFFNNESVSFTQAQITETEYWGKKAYIDYINGKFASLEEAYKSKFVQNTKGQWILKKYSIDSYRHLLTDPNDKNSIGAVALKPWSVTLHSRQRGYDSYEALLEFSLDGKVSVLESTSFYDGKSGGGKEYNLPYDYFQTKSIDEFAEFLSQNLINKDWIHTNHLKSNPYIKELFNTICAQCRKSVARKDCIAENNKNYCVDCIKKRKAHTEQFEKFDALSDTDDYEKYLEQREKFKNLTLKEQLDLLEESTDENNLIIGQIYIKEKLFLELKDGKQNIITIAKLFENATLVKEYGSTGMGDTLCRWIFAIDNLLIGISGTSFYGGPVLVGGDYNVYRFDKTQQITNFDIADFERLLF